MFINTKNICRSAQKLIAVSQSTAHDLVSLYGIGKEKIEIIHSAVGHNFKIIDRNDAQLIKTKEEYALPYHFILILGTIEPRKNIIGTVRAYNALQEYASAASRQDLLKYELVIVGESGWNAATTFSEIENSPYRKKIKVIHAIPNEAKPYLYNLSALFVYPSFFEGFGFPPLEAMKCGVPVITSNNSSLPEVVGDAAILVDPDKPDELYRAMREALTDHELRETLAKKGLEKAKEFDWMVTARKTLKVFNSL